MAKIETEKTKLHNGVIIPKIGYRVDKDHPEQIYENVLKALRAGFRHIDLPCDSESEKLVGKALKDSGIPRYEIFLTVKLDNNNHGYDAALRAFSNSLKRIGTDYADLYLINWPNPVKYRKDYEKVSADTWRALETMYKNGTAHSIGLANYEARHMEFVLENSEISPMANQARIYPGFPFEDNLNCADEHKIQSIAFLPPNYESIVYSKEVKIFAEKYNVEPWEICVRYQLQKGCLALCQEGNEEILNQLNHVFDFEISKDDMKFMNHMKNYGPLNINPDTCDF